jgi:hypothetical protein
VPAAADGNDAVQLGNDGIWLQDDAANATFTDVTVRGMSGVSVHIGCASLFYHTRTRVLWWHHLTDAAPFCKGQHPIHLFCVLMAAFSRLPTTRARSYRATATLTRVRAEAGKSSGFWLRGSGACTLSACVAAECGSFGLYVDAAAPCVFQDCEALRCYDAGVVFDLPYTWCWSTAEPLRSPPPPRCSRARRTPRRCVSHAQLMCRACTRSALSMHAERTCHTRIDSRAQGFKSISNGTYGARVAGGVGVDLTDAVLANNAWNGVRVEHALLPGASASASAPSIILTSARISGNGRGKDADPAQCDTAGLVIEATRHNTSRHAAIVPALSSTPPALLGGGGGDSPVFEGNAGGAWALWRDMASS